MANPVCKIPAGQYSTTKKSNTGIVYCESGFGPRAPWGLVWLGDVENEHMPMGMDSQWFSTLLDAYFESFAATELPVWRVFKIRAIGAFAQQQKPPSRLQPRPSQRLRQPRQGRHEDGIFTN
jgi:hypothetical protein